jgi:putative SOS response-associated peptidase YedK
LLCQPSRYEQEPSSRDPGLFSPINVMGFQKGVATYMTALREGVPTDPTFPPFKQGAGYGTNFRSLKNHLWRGWLDREHRCVVPATAFSEPDKTTPKAAVVRLSHSARGRRLPARQSGVLAA